MAYYCPMAEAVSRERIQQLLVDAGRFFSPSAPVDEKSLFAGRLSDTHLQTRFCSHML
jgi:hypothetical protein